MKPFTELKVWHKSHALTLYSYRLTSAFPKQEMFGLTSQIRRCSASIAANIAEGCGRSSGADLNRFLQIAMGSASELKYHFLLARDLGYLNPRSYQEADKNVTEVKMMLSAVIIKIEQELGRRNPGRALAT